MKASELLDNELKHKKRTVADVVRYLKTKENNSFNYTVLLGAGASITSGIRSASCLVDEWMAELFLRFKGERTSSKEEMLSYFSSQHAGWFNPENPYSSLFEKKFDLPSQRRRFVESEVDGKLPSIGYAYLSSLVNKGFLNAVFTTNFDDLLNEAFYQFVNTRPIHCAHDSSIHSVSISSKRPKIIKIHGDYLFDDIKITLRETESLEQNIKDKLIEFSKEYGLLVVGYSGNDRSVMDVLNFLVKQENYLTNGIYWCLRSDDYVSHSLRSLLWKDKVYPVVIDGFDEFFACVHNEVSGGFLNIRAGSKESKFQKTISRILDDECDLCSKSEVIKKDVEEIRDESNKQDISGFLEEISKDADDNELGVSDVRNLLGSV